MKRFNLQVVFALLLALAGPLGAAGPTGVAGPMSVAGPTGVAVASPAGAPETVTIASTFQDELGCPGPWQPDCSKTFLTYDAEDDVWQASFDLPANTDETDRPPRYKAALNGAWTENYGADAKQGGADIPLELDAAETVKFYYDDKTHWVTDSHNKIIATAVGDFQSELGCQNDNDPGCLRSWLEDPAGSGTYSLVTTALPAGTYEVKVAINESMDENYGADGAQDGEAIQFTVKADGDEIYFGYDPASHTLLVSTEGAPHGSLSTARAYWVTRDTIVWPGVGGRTNQYFLNYDPAGAMALGVEGVTGGAQIPLTFAPSGPGAAVLKKFPHLTGLATLKLSSEDAARAPEILKGQIALSAFDENGKLLDATTPQIPGVLDDLFTYSGSLGVTYDGATPTVRVWAPTARSVYFAAIRGCDHDQRADRADECRPGDGGVDRGRHARVDRPILPVRSRSLRAQHRAGRAQPGDRPLFDQPVDEQHAQPDRGSRTTRR